MLRRFLPCIIALTSTLPLLADSPEVLNFVRQNCVACHNPTAKAGDLDLKQFTAAKTFTENREIWERVLEKLKTGQMPPPATPQPPAATVTAVTGWLQAEFTRQDGLLKPEAGRVTARRLNR